MVQTMGSKLRVGNMSLELTRRCNMACEHCLRGDAQNVDITEDTIRTVLKQIESINSLCLTGGEIALVPHLITVAADCIRDFGVTVGCVDITTNAAIASDEFILSLVNLCCLSESPDMNSIRISQDVYHDSVPPCNIARLKILRATHLQAFRMDDSSFMQEGRAYWNGIGGQETPCGSVTISDGNTVDEGTLYINALGNVIVTSGDWSYESQEDESIGNVADGALIDILTASSLVNNLCESQPVYVIGGEVVVDGVKI